jgi:hypothetical protein
VEYCRRRSIFGREGRENIACVDRPARPFSAAVEDAPMLTRAAVLAAEASHERGTAEILIEMHPGQHTSPSPRRIGRRMNRGDAGGVASCPPEGFVNFIGDIAPGPADVVEILLGQPRQFAPHRVSVVPHMEDFAHLAKRSSEKAKSMMIYRQKN